MPTGLNGESENIMLGFGNNYNSERSIKNLAKFLLACVYILWGLSAFVSLIILLVNGGIGIYNTFTHFDVRSVKSRWQG